MQLCGRLRHILSSSTPLDWARIGQDHRLRMELYFRANPLSGNSITGGHLIFCNKLDGNQSQESSRSMMDGTISFMAGPVLFPTCSPSRFPVTPRPFGDFPA